MIASAHKPSPDEEYDFVVEHVEALSTTDTSVTTDIDPDNPSALHSSHPSCRLPGVSDETVVAPAPHRRLV